MLSKSTSVLVLGALALLIGCGGGESDEKSGDGDSGAGGNIDLGDEDVGFVDEVTPVLVEGRAWCSAGSDSSGMLFFVEVDYADPQGDYDVESGSLVGREVDGGRVIFDEPLLVCRDGECQGSFRDGLYPPITCSTARDYEFIATLIDRSGNPSAELLLEWEG